MKKSEAVSMLVINQIARTAHEVNRAYCESIGDRSQKAWGDSKEWQQASAINGVKFHIDNPDAKPKDSHDSWLAEKKREGWKYGEEKDVKLKLHPCMVVYNRLPPEQKTKDFLFIGVVRSFYPYNNNKH
tara:strand:- start:1318 stop:1704 length:387 start_codon:yes stop_codon:yes gene_type:complete